MHTAMASADGTSRRVVIATLGAIAASRSSLKNIVEQKVDVETARKILKLSQTVQKIGEDYDQKRNELLSQKGTPLGGNQYQIAAEVRGEFDAEMAKIESEDIHIPLADCISFQDLSAVKLSAQELEAISFAIKDYE